ncbi:hypothetical protein, partial [Enterococcus faecalis]|uniref:hypothetical protein n=1 Tax=Enterococcus faecalis TaxID=1351 RepID=UPI00403983BC
MKKYYNKLTAFIITLVMFTSCTKNFDNLNTDPNRPVNVNPGVVIGQLQYKMVNNSISAARNFTHELM